MIQRFFRIYPLHFFMLTVYLAFELGFAVLAPASASRQPFDGVYSLPAFFSSLFLVQIFTGPDNLPWNGPSWSIAAEFWAYLLFALVMRFRPRLIMPLCVCAIVAAPLYLSLLTDRNISVFHDGAFARCLYGFALGVLCWKGAEHIRGWTVPAWADSLIEFAAVFAVAAYVTLTGIDASSLAAPLVFAFAVGIFSRERGIVSGLLVRRPFVMLGTLSYSINVMGVAERVTGLDLVATRAGKSTLAADPLTQFGLTVLLLAGVVVVAWFSHRFIEQPGIRFGRKLATQRTTAIPPAAATNGAIA